MTYEEYCSLQEKRKAKPNQPQIVVTQDSKGNIVVNDNSAASIAQTPKKTRYANASTG